MKIQGTCPKCKTEGAIRKILWGMPIEPVDESKYVIGGCIPGNEKYECIACGYSK